MRGAAMSRIDAFSDVVFGFALTLLVVSLEVPKTFSELQESLRGFIPFAICFALLLSLWHSHFVFFRRYGLHDQFTILLNSCLLFVVLFYVYPLKFMATAIVAMFGGNRDVVLRGDQVGALFIIYGIGWTMVFLMIALLYRHVYKARASLGLDAIAGYDAHTYSIHYLGFAAVGALSVVLAYSGIGVRYGIPGFAYALVGPLSAINGSSRRKKRGIVERVGTGDFDVVPEAVITPTSATPAAVIHEVQTGAH